MVWMVKSSKKEMRMNKKMYRQPSVTLARIVTEGIMADSDPVGRTTLASWNSDIVYGDDVATEGGDVHLSWIE
jgi:hypothetical protein